MADIRIELATLAHLDAIVANNIAMAAETEGLALDPEVARAGVRRVLTSEERGRYYVALGGDLVIGQVLITREWSDWRDDWFWWLQSVYVLPAARGHGVFRQLHEFIEQKARKTPGVCGLRLYVDRNNEHARKIYEQMGMHAANYDFMELSWKELGSADPPAE
ncbi:MAG: GNAT family N-acetyltransferase [Phycisphaerae bacterium]|jgi:GNAT superfamily N-acetyltransferase